MILLPLMPHLLIRDRPIARLLEVKAPTTDCLPSEGGPCTQMLRRLSRVDRNLRRQAIGFSGLSLVMVMVGLMAGMPVERKSSAIVESETTQCRPHEVLRVSDRQCYILQGE